MLLHSPLVENLGLIQLVREDNPAGGYCYEWTYDNGGNIKARKEYTYTGGELGTPVTVTYTYANNGWGDLLTAYNGEFIAYDALGNPTDDGTWTYDWEHGRQLASMSNGTTTWSYTYNADGLRTSKSNGSVTYNYTYTGDKLTYMTVGDNLHLHFAYDASGVPMSVTYNGTTYYYVTNVQGDVIGILDSNGTQVATYAYDAWGNPLAGTDSQTSEIGTLNPLRYRSYVYDSETKLYYLQSRYYNSETGRWLNMDCVMGVNQDMVTYNLFVYCGNNPVCRYDVGGAAWKDLVYDVLHGGNDYFLSIGIDTAAIGAFFLMMEPDGSGVYHTKFNCWQQIAGYNDLYDYAFDIATSMGAAKFSFSYAGCGYTIWAWKGDYINMGAGAELGIYRGSSGHRFVDTSLAMTMSIVAYYKNNRIIGHSPGEKQWWITGFNPNYLNVNAADLSVMYQIRFNDSGMYNAFKAQWGHDSRWSFYDYLGLAVLQL